MQHGRNNGKKLMAVRIIKHSFDIIHLLTDQNPIQVLVDAIINRCATHWSMYPARMLSGQCRMCHSASQCALPSLELHASGRQWLGCLDTLLC